MTHDDNPQTGPAPEEQVLPEAPESTEAAPTTPCEETQTDNAGANAQE